MQRIVVGLRLNVVTAVTKRVNRLAVGFLACIALAACGSHASGGGQSSNTRWCTRADLTVSTLPISPETGEHGLELAFRDGTRPCVVQGRPSIGFLDRNRVMVPLITTATNQYVRKMPEKAVRLVPGRSAFVLVAKYRCDLGDAQVATVAEIRLAHGGGTMTADVRSADLARCRGPTHGPGQTIAVSPFVHSQREAD